MQAQLQPGIYAVTMAQPARRRRTKSEEDITIEQALAFLRRRMVARSVLSSPQAVKDYLQLALAREMVEKFSIMFLDAQNRLIQFETMFSGTLTQTSVYPREIVRRALELHAAAVIFAHNHPSGTVEPSRADELLTKTLKDSLALVDVRVLDHIIVAPGHTMSFAERGLL